MNKDQHLETAISDFTGLVYSKGYRGRFNLRYPSGNRTEKIGLLSDCLRAFVDRDKPAGKKGDVFELEMFLEYKSAADNICCVFEVRLDDVKGFLVQQLTVTNAASRETRHYRGFYSNHQLPGSQQVTSLFPKPKPWDHLLRGKFRP